MSEDLAAIDRAFLQDALAKIGRRPSADDEHDFIERVGQKTDSNINDREARLQALTEFLSGN